MQHPTYLELEQEISKMAYAIQTRNSLIGKDLIDNLRDRFSLEDIAGVMLVSLEQLVWCDSEAFVWAVENLVPIDVVLEIRRITSVAVSKRLIGQGLQPGEDFSVDAMGKLLLNDRAKAVVLKG